MPPIMKMVKLNKKTAAITTTEATTECLYQQVNFSFPLSLTRIKNPVRGQARKMQAFSVLRSRSKRMQKNRTTFSYLKIDPVFLKTFIAVKLVFSVHRNSSQTIYSLIYNSCISFRSIQKMANAFSPL